MVSLTSMNSWRLSDLWTVQKLITQNQRYLWKSILQCIQYTSFLSLPTVHSLTLGKQTSQEDDWGSKGKETHCFLWVSRFWQDLTHLTDHWVKLQTTLQRHLTSLRVLVTCCPPRGVIDKNATCSYKKCYTSLTCTCMTRWYKKINQK